MGMSGSVEQQSMQDYVRQWLGLPPAAQQQMVKGAPTMHYPDAIDVDQARQSDFSYGSGNEAYNSGRVANVAFPAKGASLTAISDPNAARARQGTPDTATAYEAAQLAVNQSPIAGLGYDPHKINLDTASGKDVGVAGVYNPKTDTIFSNAAYPPNLVHESLHRGLESLRRDNLIPPALQKRLPSDEEQLVRYIMAQNMGDPERGVASINDKQRADALFRFGANPNNPLDYNRQNEVTDDRRKALDELNKIASQQVYRRNPRGPR